MSEKEVFLSPAEAAQKLGVSVKALRLYESHGLLSPVRSEAGWRAYGPEQMERASAIAGLRSIGVGLKQIGVLLRSDKAGMADALGAHQGKLERQARRIGASIGEVRARRAALVQDHAGRSGQTLRFALPWPWDGETFVLKHLPALTFITGPLGCGKTRLAQALAEHIPGAAYIGLERLDAAPAGSAHALDVMIGALDNRGDTIFVVDMVEEGMDEATQIMFMEHVRAGLSETSTPLFFMTRSSTILEMTAMGADELIIHCPANHSPPELVLPFPGAPGREAVASCLAPPHVRARTAGVVAAMAG